MVATTIDYTAASELQERNYTVAEYLEIEELTQERHAFYNGKIVKMAGGTINHNFQEYVLIRQDTPEVTTLFREETNLWRDNDVEGLEQSVFLKSLNISLLMSKIYKKVF